MDLPKGELTALLRRACTSDDRAARDEAYELLKDEMKKIARRRLPKNAGDSLPATILMDEAFVRLTEGAALSATDRKHFFCIASRVMRNIVADHFRGKKKRPGEIV